MIKLDTNVDTKRMKTSLITLLKMYGIFYLLAMPIINVILFITACLVSPLEFYALAAEMMSIITIIFTVHVAIMLWQYPDALYSPSLIKRLDLFYNSPLRKNMTWADYGL